MILRGRPVKFRPRSSFRGFCCIEPQIQAALDNDEIMMQVRSVCHTSDARGSPCITFWRHTDSLWFFFPFLYDDWYPTHADNINISGMALIYIEEPHVRKWQERRHLAWCLDSTWPLSRYLMGEKEKAAANFWRSMRSSAFLFYQLKVVLVAMEMRWG